MEAIKKISEYVAQLRRVGKGHGMVEDPMLNLFFFIPGFPTSLLVRFIGYFFKFCKAFPSLEFQVSGTLIKCFFMRRRQLLLDGESVVLLSIVLDPLDDVGLSTFVFRIYLLRFWVL